MKLDPVRARRGVDCLVECGACQHVIAHRHRDHLLFVEARVQAMVQHLPATVDCPFCHVPNLVCPKRLNVSERQAKVRQPHSTAGPAVGLLIF